MDCFNGEIVALEMRDNMKKELCIDTVRQLGRIYPNLKGAVFHSDRGSQYTSAAFRAELSRRGMVQSLSGTGHCFDNARMESFFATLKKREDLSDRGVQAAERTSQNDHFSLYFYLLQPRQGLYTQPAWATACEVPGVDAGAAGSLTGATELFRFWVFPDCTFLDISTIAAASTPKVVKAKTRSSAIDSMRPAFFRFHLLSPP